MRLSVLSGIGLATLATVSAAAEKSQVRASNGVVIDVHSDSFAERYEYSAPSVKFSEEGSSLESFALVAAVKKAGVIDRLRNWCHLLQWRVAQV